MPGGTTELVLRVRGREEEKPHHNHNKTRKKFYKACKTVAALIGNDPFNCKFYVLSFKFYRSCDCG